MSRHQILYSKKLNLSTVLNNCANEKINKNILFEILAGQSELYWNYELRLCSNKWSNRVLITLKVSKIKIFANFTIKNVMVCNISIPFVFFTNNFIIHPKKGQKNGQKTESCSRILVCHFTEKRSMRLFLEIEYRIEKNYWFWPNSKFVTYLTHGHPLEN
jgi:hypothetical protein